MGKEKKKFTPQYSKKVTNANVYAAIVERGGDKRVAALAAKKHTMMDPNENRAYIAKKANQAYNPDTKRDREPKKPKRQRKSSPVRNRRPKKK